MAQNYEDIHYSPSLLRYIGSLMGNPGQPQQLPQNQSIARTTNVYIILQELEDLNKALLNVGLKLLVPFANTPANRQFHMLTLEEVRTFLEAEFWVDAHPVRILDLECDWFDSFDPSNAPPFHKQYDCMSQTYDRITQLIQMREQLPGVGQSEANFINQTN